MRHSGVVLAGHGALWVNPGLNNTGSPIGSFGDDMWLDSR
jgi:hypothetical protein